MDENEKKKSFINRRAIAVIAFLVLIFAGSLIAIIAMSHGETDAKYVRVYYDGELIEEYSLSEDGVYRIEPVDGEYNIIEIEDGTVCVSEANCANQTCVETGKIDSSAYPIVCLPHNLVIKIEGGEQSVDGVAN